jgi:hypothetical protein
MSNPTVVEILRQVSVLLHDTDPQFARWAERDLVSYLNDGQRAIAKYLPVATTRVVSIKLRPQSRQSIAIQADTEAVDEFDDTLTAVDGLQLVDVIRLMGADGKTPGRAMRLVTRETLDAALPDWHKKSGEPRNFVFSPSTPTDFWVYPQPPSAGAAVWAEISYIANPDEIPNTGTEDSPAYGQDSREETVISIGPRWSDDLVNYIVARCYLRDSEDASNAALANLFAQQFVGSINAQAQVLTGKNPNLKLLPFAPVAPEATQ